MMHNNVPENVALRLYGITKWGPTKITSAFTISSISMMNPVHAAGEPGNSPLCHICTSGTVRQQHHDSRVGRAVYKRLAEYNSGLRPAGGIDGYVNRA